MHLVFISTLGCPAIGGSEKLWSHCALRALHDGHRVTVYVNERESLEHFLHELVNAGADLRFWPDQFPRRSIPRRIARRILGRALPESEWWRAKLVRDASVICLNQGGSLCVLRRHGLMEATLRTRSPYVCLARADTGFPLLDNESRPLAKAFFEGAHAFLSASQSAIDLMRLHLPSGLPRSTVLHSPIADYGMQVPSYPEGDILRLACVGRLSVENKGQNLLLSCLASDKWRPRPYELRLYGEGPDRQYLRDLIAFLGLQDKVKLMGHSESVADIWTESHIAVQPSLVEGAPQSVLEAMLCRRATIATAVCGIPEWVEEGRTGFLAEAPTVKYLDAALERAWQHRHRWQEMGVTAQATCLAKRDPDPAGTLLKVLMEAATGGVGSHWNGRA